MQVLSKIGVTFATRFPPIFSGLILHFNVFSLDFLDLVPLGCVFAYNFRTLLLLRTLVPLGLAAVALLVGMVRKKLMASATSLIFDLFFLVYPSTSMAIFSAFQYEQLDDIASTKVLRADFHIEYDSIADVRIYAGIMMVVYPFGVPLIFAYLLFYKYHSEVVSTDVLKVKEMPSYVDKLVGDYQGRYYYFEIVECARKLLLLCAPVFFEPQGSVAQLVFGLMVSFLSFGLYAATRPFKQASTNTLAIATQVTIFFALLSSAVLKYDPQTLADSSNIDVVLSLLTVLTVTLPILEAILEAILGYSHLCFHLPCLRLIATAGSSPGQKVKWHSGRSISLRMRSRQLPSLTVRRHHSDAIRRV